MSTSGTNHRSENTPTTSPVVLMLGTIASTTWRMFVPIIGLTILGIYADTHLPTKPWLTLCGVVVGSFIAVMLVRQQLKNVQNQ